MTENLRTGRTCRQLLKQALVTIGILAAGQEANDSEYEDGLLTLRDMLRGYIEKGYFGPLRQITAYDDFVATENCHIFVQNPDVKILLPTLISSSSSNLAVQADGVGGFAQTYVPISSDGSSWAVVAPKDCTVVRITDDQSNTTSDWIYDGRTKTWQELYLMGLEKECPLSFGDGNGLKNALAVELSMEYGVDPSPLVMRSALQFEYNLTVRYTTLENDYGQRVRSDYDRY